MDPSKGIMYRVKIGTIPYGVTVLKKPPVEGTHVYFEMRPWKYTIKRKILLCVPRGKRAQCYDKLLVTGVGEAVVFLSR